MFKWKQLIIIFTVRKRRCGKIMFSRACIKNSVYGGGVQPHPLGRHPPGRHPADRHPLGRHPLGRHPLCKHPQADIPRQTHPLPLVDTPLPPAHQTASASDGTHPTGMHSCCFNVYFYCSSMPNQRRHICKRGAVMTFSEKY